MIVDAHYHLEPRMQTVDDLLAHMDRHRVDRIALIATMCDPFYVGRLGELSSALLRAILMRGPRGLGLGTYRGTVTRDGRFSLLGKTYRIYSLPDNETVSRAMQAHPEQFFGWIFVNPGAGDALEQVDKWIHKPGWIGVKSHPFWHSYPVSLLDPVAGFCEEQGLPLLVHLGGDKKNGDYALLPERHPKLKIIYAHAGVPFFRELWAYAQGKPNVYVDLSAPLYVDERVALGAVQALGARRCLFGTDGPYGPSEHGRMLSGILSLRISDEEKERILGVNFMELVGRRGDA